MALSLRLSCRILLLCIISPVVFTLDHQIQAHVAIESVTNLGSTTERYGGEDGIHSVTFGFGPG